MKLPGYTCSKIDEVIDQLKRARDAAKELDRFSFDDAESAMEDLRDDNAKMREAAEEQEERACEAEEKLEKAEARVAELEKELAAALLDQQLASVGA